MIRLTYLFGLILGLTTWVMVRFLIAPKIKLSKDKTWGISVAITILVVGFYMMYSFNLLFDPIMFVSTIALSGLSYLSNQKYYKQKVIEKNRSKGSRRH